MLLCAGAAAASADLAGGLLACPSCSTGRLKRWGHGRERVIQLRPDRARCRSCGRTHIVLPSWCAPRRADAIEVIGTALAAALGGAGPALPGPASSPLHDALNAVAAAAHAAITGRGFGSADLWPLLGRFGLARHLMPARAG